MMKAKYTVVLKTLMDNEQAMPAITKALSTYPLYSNEKSYDLIPDRAQLNKRLLDHYKYREIGFETVGRFLDELEITMCEIMPRYNELFKTVVTMAELPSPFDNVDVVETFEQERINDSKTTSDSTTNTSTTAHDKTTTKNDVTSFNKQVQSQTPQGKLDITAEGIDTIPAADQANWGKDNSSSNGESTSDGTTTANGGENSTVKNDGKETTKHTYTKTGNQGVNTYAHDMEEYRTVIIDVVNQIVTDPRIAELFMLVY